MLVWTACCVRPNTLPSILLIPRTLFTSSVNHAFSITSINTNRLCRSLEKHPYDMIRKAVGDWSAQSFKLARRSVSIAGLVPSAPEVETVENLSPHPSPLLFRRQPTFSFSPWLEFSRCQRPASLPSPSQHRLSVRPHVHEAPCLVDARPP